MDTGRAWPHGRDWCGYGDLCNNKKSLDEDWRGINGEPGHMVLGSGVDIWSAWPHDGGDGIIY